MDRLGFINRLASVGLREPAEAYKEVIRRRERGKGADRETAKDVAWEEMREVYLPVLERKEREREEHERKLNEAIEGKFTVDPVLRLNGLPVDTDRLLDPEYKETDPGKQLRDGLLWAAFEWMKVIKDTKNGPVANIPKASIPPPNAFALFILSTYALSPVEKRRELITRALAFANRSHDTPEGAPPNVHEDDGFLSDIE